METVKRIAARVQAGQRTLDVGTARDLIKAATEDSAIDAKTELAVMRDLFEPGRVRSTATGKQLLEAFVQQAAPLVGGPNGDVVNLEDRAVTAVVRSTSEAAIAPLLDQYQGTRSSDGRVKADIEKQRRSAQKALRRYLSSTNVFRGLVGFLARSKQDRLENDPLRNVRRLLEDRYTPV